MGLRRSFINLVNGVLQKTRYRLIDKGNLYEWQTSHYRWPRYRKKELPEDIAGYLTWSNPRLVDLQNRYEHFNFLVTEPLVWTDEKLQSVDIQYFRGDNAYLWQLRGRNMHEMGYAISAYYTMSIDTLNLFDILSEDEWFGNFTFEVAKKTVSRDLLDSVNEICFLESQLALSSRKDFSIVDIGAGYGRLAHRMTQAFPDLGHYYCTDAVAVSTFLCDFYLGFRGVSEKASAVPLDEIEQVLTAGGVSLAVNVHSFSECRVSAIRWWLDLIARSGIRYLMIVPNHYDARTGRLMTNDGHDITRCVLDAGYRQMAVEPKYRDPLVQKYAINPGYYALFELQ